MKDIEVRVGAVMVPAVPEGDPVGPGRHAEGGRRELVRERRAGARRDDVG